MVVVDKSNVTPVKAPEMRLVLELTETPSMTAKALAAAWGGGGAGGVLFSTAYPLNTDGPTTFTVTIGGGGAGAADGANTTVTSNAPGGTKTGLKGGKGGDQGQYGSGGNGTYGSGGGGGRDTGQNTGPVGQT